MEQKTNTSGLASEVRLVLRYTRLWLHYGLIGFAVLCSVIAALRGAVTR
jgi:hypothetical protein